MTFRITWVFVLACLAGCARSDPRKPVEEQEHGPVDARGESDDDDGDSNDTGDSVEAVADEPPLSDRLASGPVVIRAAFVNEPHMWPRGNDVDGGPALEIISLGQDFAARAANYTDKEQLVFLSDVRINERVALLVALEAFTQDRRSTMRDCEPGGTFSNRVRRPTTLRLPPHATIDLGRGRAYVAQGIERTWVRVVFKERWCLDTPSVSARLSAYWDAPSPLSRSDGGDGLYVRSADYESTLLNLVPELLALRRFASQPLRPRLPMPDHLRDTARELGIE